MKILVLNGGSSSLKATLRDLNDKSLSGDPSAPLWDAQADWGRQEGKAQVRAGGRRFEMPIGSPADVLQPVIDTLWRGQGAVLGGPGDIDGVGHRVVHGGQSLQQSTRVTAAVKAEILKYCEFAPE